MFKLACPLYFSLAVVNEVHMEHQLEIALDLDDTALNTAAFKQYLADSLAQYRVSTEAFFDAYRGLRAENSFSIEKLVDALQTNEAHRDAMVRSLTEKISDSERFLYPDVFTFIRQAHRHGARVVLFTYGDKVVQELKLSGLQALVYAVDEVRITEDGDKTLPTPSGNMRRVVVDDRPEILERYIDDPRVTPILVVRSGIKRKESSLPAYSSLDKVVQVLTKEGLW